MMINIVLFDNAAIGRVKQKSYQYFKNKDGKRFYNNVIWLEKMYIEFCDRIIVINILDTIVMNQTLVNDYLNVVLENEEVSINYAEKSEYTKSYLNNSKMVITYT